MGAKMAETIRFLWVIRAGMAALLLCSPWVAQEARADNGSKYKTVEWQDLIPPEELEILQNPPAYITEIEEGSAEDQGGELRNSGAAAADDPYQQALVSTNVIEELDGQAIRVPGFVVPLEFSDFQNISEFLLVPYFGACIHLPAPPPNQIILVNSPQGFQLDDLYEPFWFSGVVKTSITENDVATSAYSLDMQEFERYYQD